MRRIAMGRYAPRRQADAYGRHDESEDRPSERAYSMKLTAARDGTDTFVRPAAGDELHAFLLRAGGCHFRAHAFGLRLTHRLHA